MEPPFAPALLRSHASLLEDGRDVMCFRFGHFFSKLATRSIKCRVSKGFVSALRLLCATTLQIKAYSLS